MPIASSSASPPDERFDVLLVGAGGIGAPAGRALVASGIGSLLVLDDDDVELSNLHRQIWFGEADVGRSKVETLSRALREMSGGRCRVEPVTGRALPETVLPLLSRARVVLDGTDNFATRFLLADAGVIAGVPVVHAASVRWQGTCFVAGSAAGAPCYRCLFEDLPEGPAPDCAGAGVLGPVCGVIGALGADAALRVLQGDERIRGTIATFDGRRRAMRRVKVRPRPDCPLCGAQRSITTVDRSRYVQPMCEAW